MGLFSRLRGRASRRVEPSVTIDDQGVRRQLADGRTEQVSWDGLRAVWAVTTSDGPWADDVFYILEDAHGGVSVPQSVTDEAFLARLQALPGFDNEALISAMGSTGDARFDLWRQPDD